MRPAGRPLQFEVLLGAERTVPSTGVARESCAAQRCASSSVRWFIDKIAAKASLTIAAGAQLTVTAVRDARGALFWVVLPGTLVA